MRSAGSCIGHSLLVALLSAIFSALSAGYASATTPVITVKSPTNKSSVTSAIHYVATATSNQCSKGMSAMQLYSGPGVLVYATDGGTMNTYISLNPGTYNTTVQAWDNCGGYAKSNLTITVTSANAGAGYLYISESNSNLVRGYTISAQGSLTAIAQGGVKTNVEPESVASDKGGYRLYVGDYKSGDVFAYFINRSSGYLTPVPGDPFPVNRSVTAVAVHPSGHFIFAARDENAPGDGVAVFHLNSNGSLSQVAGSPFSTENDPNDLVVDPSGKYLYVADASSQKIDAFSINEVDGALTPLPGSPYVVPAAKTCGSEPLHLIDFAGKYVYTANVFDNSIGGFNVSSAGTLADMPGSPFLDNGGGCNPNGTPYNPEFLAIDGSGKFLYGANRGLNSISIYAIQSNGTLKFVSNTPTQYGNFCQGPIRTDAAGNYLYGVGCGSPTGNLQIVGFAINHTTGSLSLVPGSPFLTSKNYYILGIATTP